ncbi:MAG: RNA polymerase sigma factor [Acidobacteriota bacterium]
MDFHTLYSRYASDVKRFILCLSGDPALAEDITAETFVRAWTAPGRIRSATVKSYLFTIARNQYLQGLRRHKKHAGLDERTPDPTPDPQHRATQRQALGRVLGGLAKLPEIDRAALLMRAQDELPYADIARTLGLSISGVRVKVHRARLKLAQLRQPQEDSA